MAENPHTIAGLWTHRQTAAFLRVTPGTLYVWLSKGDAPRSFKVGGSRRYDPQDVQTFLRQRVDQATAPTADTDLRPPASARTRTRGTAAAGSNPMTGADGAAVLRGLA